MNDKPTYQELENQVTKLQKQYKILGIDFAVQILEKEKSASELITANIELDYQTKEKGKRACELKITNIELENETEAREKCAAELILAHAELDHQSSEKVKRADELKSAKVERRRESDEKDKRAAELIIANIELVFQKEEKEKRAAELIISNIKFAQQSVENEKLSEALIIANLAVTLQSELIAAKEKAEEHKIQLEELIADRDTLFSIIAHDLRSPFQSIMGLSDLLIEDCETNKIQENFKLLGMISLTAKHTLVLLDNLLNWAKLQKGQIKSTPENLVLATTIHDLLNISIAHAKIKAISLSYDQDSDIQIFTDVNMLKLVLRNLISNAIKFTRAGGNINITAITHQNRVEISVSDNGVGMTAEKVKNLFNLAENSSSIGTANERGSGLGLVLCKDFVEKLNGKIWVESEVGNGSNFKFTLPLNTEGYLPKEP